MTVTLLNRRVVLHFSAAFADDLVEHLCRNVFAVPISEAMRLP